MRTVFNFVKIETLNYYQLFMIAVDMRFAINFVTYNIFHEPQCTILFFSFFFSFPFFTVAKAIRV